MSSFAGRKNRTPTTIAQMILVVAHRTLDDRFVDDLCTAFDRDVGGDPESNTELLLYSLAPFQLALAQAATPQLVDILDSLRIEALNTINAVRERFGARPYSIPEWNNLFASRLEEYFEASTAPNKPGMPIADHPLSRVARIAASYLAPGCALMPDTRARLGSHFAAAMRYAGDVLADNGIRHP